MTEVAIAIPCFNEARRLDSRALVELAQQPGFSLVLVDDGSVDGTLELLHAIREQVGNTVRVLPLERNVGKGEAVRRGLLAALEGDAAILGYLDADLSTPVAEMFRLVGELKRSAAQAALGSRVRLLGRSIERHPWRHYLGRIFATAASATLGLPVYDTQCGAKLFRRNGALVAALARPFSSRWVFDVELLARLLGAPQGMALAANDFLEVPLLSWRDVGGSKLGAAGMLGAALDLSRLALERRLGRA